MAELRRIMYVGLQIVPSFDRPNNRPDRVWNGPGDVVGDVPPLQAATLLSHPSEWADVTHLEGEALRNAQAGARAASERRVRELKNPADAPNNKRSIDAMSVDEIEIELRRRQREAAAEANAAPEELVPPAPNKANVPSERSDSRLAMAGAAAIERILTRVGVNSDLASELLTDDGIPKQGVLEEEMGIKLSEEEYRVAVGLPA